MSYCIQTYQLCKSFGSRAVLQNVELHVPQGQIYGFLGPNGAGKTTVLKLLTNLLKPTSGTIELFGQPLLPGSCDVFRRMGSIIEFPVFYEHLSGRENLEIHRQYMGYYHPGDIDEALELLGLRADADKSVKRYSLGMRQRLGIARAILTRAELLLLDEPTNGLDAAGVKQIRDLLRMLSRDWGVTVLMASHLLSEVEHTADLIGLIHQGHMLKELSLAELSELSLSYLELISPDVQKAAYVLEELLQIREFKVLENGVIRIYSTSLPPEELFRRLALHDVAVASFHKHAESLEDYYLKMTGEAPA